MCNACLDQLSNDPSFLNANDPRLLEENSLVPPGEGMRLTYPVSKAGLFEFLLVRAVEFGKVALVDLVMDRFCIAAQYSAAQLSSTECLDICYHTACHAFDLGQTFPLVSSVDTIQMEYELLFKPLLDKHRLHTQGGH